jgi:hypothetical protein
MDLRPVNFPIKCWRNDTLTLNFEMKVNDVPLDLSGATVRMQIRPSYGSNTLTLSIAEGTGITVTGDDDNIVSISKLITITAGEYVYDLEIQYASGEVKTYVQGAFSVHEDVTK